MDDADAPPRVMLWHRLAGRNVGPSPVASAVAVAIFLLVSIARVGTPTSGVGAIAYIAPTFSGASAVAQLGLVALGIGVGSVGSALLGGPLTLMLALVPVALALPVMAFVLIGSGAASNPNTTIGVLVAYSSVVTLSAGAASGASWSVLAIPHARRAVPASPYVAATAAMMLVPLLGESGGMVWIVARVFAPFAAAPALAMLVGWMVAGWSAEPAPSIEPEPRDVALTVALCVASAAIWMGLWVWLPLFEHGLVTPFANDMPGLRAAILAGVGLVLATGAAALPRASSLAWIGAACIALGGAVAMSLTPLWYGSAGVVTGTFLYAFGSIVLFAAVARRVVEHAPPGLVPIALGLLLVLVGFHESSLPDLLGAYRAARLESYVAMPLAVGCAAWGAALVVASRFVDRADAEGIAISGLPEGAAGR